MNRAKKKSPNANDAPCHGSKKFMAKKIHCVTIGADEVF
jgi:hypothetical protein